MRIHHHPKRHHTKWILWFLLICAFGGATYLFRRAYADWQQTSCTVIGNRAIQEYVADSSRALVMYQGQYRLRYVVAGRDYYVWANAGVTDPEKRFVEDKIYYLPERCDYMVRYDPEHPENSVAIRKRID